MIADTVPAVIAGLLSDFWNAGPRAGIVAITLVVAGAVLWLPTGWAADHARRLTFGGAVIGLAQRSRSCRGSAGGDQHQAGLVG